MNFDPFSCVLVFSKLSPKFNADLPLQFSIWRQPFEANAGC